MRALSEMPLDEKQNWLVIGSYHMRKAEIPPSVRRTALVIQRHYVCEATAGADALLALIETPTPTTSTPTLTEEEAAELAGIGSAALEVRADDTRPPGRV